MEIPISKHIPIPKPGEKPLKERDAQVLEAIMTAPKRTLTKKVQEIYANEGRDISFKTASTRLSEIRKKPEVMAILHEYEEKAQRGLVEVADYSTKLGKMGGKDGAAYASVALTAHDKILDRVHGRAKQSLDVTTRSVTINMDLTQALPDDTSE